MSAFSEDFCFLRGGRMASSFCMDHLTSPSSRIADMIRSMCSRSLLLDEWLSLFGFPNYGRFFRLLYCGRKELLSLSLKMLSELRLESLQMTKTGPLMLIFLYLLKSSLACSYRTGTLFTSSSA